MIHQGPGFPSVERAWVYAATRELTDEEIAEIRRQMDDFLRSWEDHGVPLRASGDVLHRRFVVLFAKNPNGRVDGCAIDKSVLWMKNLGAQLKVDFFDRMKLFYFKDNRVHMVEKDALNTLYQRGEIDDNTLFFNTVVQTREEFDRQWLLPFKDHWARRFISVGQAI